MRDSSYDHVIFIIYDGNGLRSVFMRDVYFSPKFNYKCNVKNEL